MEVGRMSPDLLQGFVKDCNLRGINTKSYKSSVSRFLAALDKDPRNVDRSDLISYFESLKARDLKHPTIARNFACISSFYTYLVDVGEISTNPVPPVQRRYLKRYKDNNGSEIRKLISVDQAVLLVNSILDIRDKTIIALLLKTGVRCGELVSLDIDDLDLEQHVMKLKPKAKRSNRLLPLDNEMVDLLRRWLNARKARYSRKTKALFPSRSSDRISVYTIELRLEKYAADVGLHDPKSRKLEERFTPHCCRHWLVTHLLRAGMAREYVKMIRGDSMREAIDIYYHIDFEDLRRSYLAHVPQLGI